MEFCKAFNAATGDMEKGQPTPTIITVFADKSFSSVTKTPPATYLIKKAANVTSRSKEPAKISSGKIARSTPASIAELKLNDMHDNEIEQPPQNTKANPSPLSPAHPRKGQTC